MTDISLWYKSWKFGMLKSAKCKKSVFMMDKYFHKLYDSVVQIKDKCYRLREDTV